MDAEWLWFGAIVLGIAVGGVLLFRSFRRWRQPPARTPDQIQAEMRLYGESQQTDRW